MTTLSLRLWGGLDKNESNHADHRSHIDPRGAIVSDIVITCPDCSTRYKATTASIGDEGRPVRCVKCGATWFVPAPDAIDTLMAGADAMALADDIAETQSPPVTAVPDTPDAPPPSGAPETGIDGPAAPDTAPRVTPKTEFGPVPTAALSRPAPPVGADVMMRDHVDREKLARRQRTIRFIWAIALILVILAAIIAYFNRQEIVNRIPQMASVYEKVGITVRVGGLEIDPPQARTVMVDGFAVIRVESVVRNLTRETKTVPLIELTLHDIDGASLIQWYVEPDPPRIEGRGRLVFTSEISDPPNGAVGLRYKFVDDVELSAASGL